MRQSGWREVGGHVEQAVEPAELLDGVVDELFVGRLVGDIEGSSNCLAAQRLDLIGDGASGRLVEICRHDGHALLGEADGGRRADVARRRAGDKGDLALQSSHCAVSLRSGLSAAAQASSWSNMTVAASSWIAATGRKVEKFSKSVNIENDSCWRT